MCLRLLGAWRAGKKRALEADIEACFDRIEKAGVPAFSPIQDGRFYFNYHHTAADTLDKVVPSELRENAAAMAG